MNALKAFKTASLAIILAFGAYNASAQQKPVDTKQKPKVKTEVKGDTAQFKNMPIIQDGKQVGIKDSTYMYKHRKTELESGENKAGQKQVTKKPVPVVKDNAERQKEIERNRKAYKEMTPEQRMISDLKYLENKEAIDKAFDKKHPKTITVMDSVLAPAVAADTIKHNREVSQVDTVYIKVKEQRTDTLKEARRLSPWRFSAGWVNLAEKGGNDILQHPAPANAGNNNHQGDPRGNTNGIYFRVRTPQFAELGKKKFGALWNASATLNLFPDEEFASVVEYRSLFSEDFEALDVTMNSADQRNSAEVTLNFNPQIPLNKRGSLKFCPEVRGGFQWKQTPRIEQIPASYNAPPEELPQNRLDLTNPNYQNVAPVVGLGATLFYDANEIKGAHKQHGLFAEASFELLKAFRNPTSQSPFQSQNKAAIDGANHHQYIRVGIGYRFR